jgi:hypothetical protein
MIGARKVSDDGRPTGEYWADPDYGSNPPAQQRRRVVQDAERAGKSHAEAPGMAGPLAVGIAPHVFPGQEAPRVRSLWSLTADVAVGELWLGGCVGREPRGQSRV